MNGSALPPPLPLPKPAPPPAQVLRRLFLTVFLRGRSSRGLQKDAAPKTVGQKLILALLFYALFGSFALFFVRQPVFGLAVYLHAMTFVFVGMFVAGSAGEVLFNKDEPDILLHRPIEPGVLLWAKISVMVQVSLWLAGAFNLVGFFAGVAAPDGGWLFPAAHAVSTVLEALFCSGCVVLVYQLCLKWFGREKLDALMTTTQVVVAVAAVVGGQLMPQLFARFGGTLNLTAKSWWICLLPPAWFAALDDALAGSRAAASWELGALGLLATAVVLWLSFAKLARVYQVGLQTLSETSSPRPRQRARRRWLAKVIDAPPFCWWLRDPVSRASFLLTAAYLARDRDVKLRIYPGLAPMLVVPIIFLVQERSGRAFGSSSLGIAFSGVYLGLIPFMGLHLLQYSQQWQAADLFRVVPIRGPAPLCHGARRAVLSFLTLPLVVLFALIAWFACGDSSRLVLLLPGLVTLPLYALLPTLGGKAVPLSQPTEEAKSANRGLSMLLVTLISFALAGIVNAAWAGGWFWWFLLGESILAATLYTTFRASLANARWTSAE